MRRPFDLEVAVLGERLGDIHHQIIVEQQLGERVGAVGPERPVRLAVQAIDGGEVGVEPGAVGAAVVLAHVEGVFQVVEVSDLQIAVDLVELLHRQLSSSRRLNAWSSAKSILIPSPGRARFYFWPMIPPIRPMSRGHAVSGGA